MKNPEINSDGTKYWYDENQYLHREDAPAIEWADGDYAWAWHETWHRDNGEHANFGQKYYFNGREIE